MKVDKYFRQCVGIDVAKDTFMACLSMLDIATDEGRSSQTVEFANNKHGFNQLVKWSRKEAVREAKLTFLMEVTGVYHENWRIISKSSDFRCTWSYQAGPGNMPSTRG